MVADVESFLRQNVLIHHSSAAIIGHSMGGKVAMKLSLDHGKLVEKLIVVDIAPVKYVDGHAETFSFLKAMKKMDLTMIQSLNHADELLLPDVPNIAIRKFLLTNLVYDEPKQYKWRVNLDSILTFLPALSDFRAENNYFGAATLFIRGSKSNYILDSYEPQMKNLFPKHRVKTIQDCGHWVHSEKPHEFLETVTTFLS